MYSSQFDGNAAFSGGGFMPSQATQTNEFGVSPAKNRDSQGLFPLTVKQINDAYVSSEDKANFIVDGVDVNNVTLVGRVINKSERVTEVAFTLDDGTGRVDCHRWMNESIDTREMEEIQEGMYARIHGNLKGFQGKKHLVAFSVRPVIDFNDIAYHLVDCMSVHVSNTRLQKVQGNAQTQPQVTHSAVTNGSMGYQATAPNQFSGQFSFDGIKGIDQKVLDYLQQPANLGKEKGVHRDELVQHLKVPLEKIMESIRSLEEEGAIYSTIDDCHYKSTVNDQHFKNVMPIDARVFLH